MNTTKVAITMPKQLVATIDALSKHKGMSRSKFISSVLRDTISQEKKRHLRETYDEVFSDEAIRKEQLETARWFEGLENEEGQNW